MDMFEKIYNKEGEVGQFDQIRKNTDFLLKKFEFIDDKDVIKINSEKEKDNLPVFISPGWGVTSDSQRDTLRVLLEQGRSVISLSFSRNKVLKKELVKNIPSVEMQKALTIIEAIDKSKKERIDAIGHSEGGLNLAIAAMFYPEKFRNIVLINPASIIEEDSCLGLIKRFMLDEGLEEFKSMKDININSFNNYFKNVFQYFIKNIDMSYEEIKSMTQMNLLDLTKELKEKSIGVSIVCGSNDKVFPIEKIIKKVDKTNLDYFISTKGNHGSFIFNKEYVLLAEDLLFKMKKS